MYLIRRCTLSNAIPRFRSSSSSFDMNVSLFDALSKVIQPIYKSCLSHLVRYTGFQGSTHLLSYINAIENEEKSMSQVFASVSSWYMMETNQI